MKKTSLVVSLALAAGFAAAQEKKAAEPQKPAQHAAAAHASRKAAKAVKPREMTAEIVATDAAKQTLTFKNAKGESVTWPAEGKALEGLASMKAGDKVTIVYRANEKGEPQAATEIKPVATKVSAAAKPAPPAKK